MNYQEAYALLKEQDQLHVLKYYDELRPDEQAALLLQISSLDLSILKAAGLEASARGSFAPLGAMTVRDIASREAELREIGKAAIRDGKTAAVLLAGGQGTRLGSAHPKGMYDIGISRPKYIFECVVGNLLQVVREAGAFIPLYIMTSEINHEETEAFFRAHDFFGYDPAFIRFFRQAMAPCTDLNGKLLMEKKYRIAVSPNGNGGWYTSMQRAGLDRDLKDRGVEYISVFGVDNVLVHINDPAYVGAVIASGCDCGGKVVRKADPNERVGVLCLEDGRPSIVEYYEMTDEMIRLRDEAGELQYAFGVILNYLFRLDRLDEIAARKLPVHFAKKKIPCLNEDGIYTEPVEPNGYKYELLVLDMIHLMDSCLPYEVVREREFAPIKNPTGIDSVESARALLQANGIEL